MFLAIEIPTDSQCFAHNFVLRLLGYSQFFSDKEEPSASVWCTRTSWIRIFSRV